MNKILILSALFSLLFTGCASSRSASKRAETSETSEAVRTEQAERGAAQIVVKHADTELEIITTVDEFDTTQPADPETGTPPLKRRETTTTKARAKETTNAETITTEKQETTTDEKQAIQTNDETDEYKATEHASVSGWFWFKAGAVLVLFIFIVVRAKKYIKNLLKPL